MNCGSIPYLSEEDPTGEEEEMHSFNCEQTGL